MPMIGCARHSAARPREAVFLFAKHGAYSGRVSETGGSAYVNIRNCWLLPILYLGFMAAFLYRCPITGHNIQGFAPDDAAVSDERAMRQ